MQNDLCLASRAKRIYANAHTYHINSISVNSDQQTFLSADDLRINLWSLDVTDQSFNIVDIKPPNMDDLTEVRCCQRAAARWMSGHQPGWACVQGNQAGIACSTMLLVNEHGCDCSFSPAADHDDDIGVLLLQFTCNTLP